VALATERLINYFNLKIISLTQNTGRWSLIKNNVTMSSGAPVIGMCRRFYSCGTDGATFTEFIKPGAELDDNLFNYKNYL
jgi:hypothetical protein